MTTGRFYKWISVTQGFYFLLTALWPLIDMQSFILVTGPKTDIWLVDTVAVLLIPISLVFLAGVLLPAANQLVILIGLITSAGLAFLDIYYSTTGVIKWLYLVDGLLELCFFFAWVGIAISAYRNIRRQDLHHLHVPLEEQAEA